MAETELSPVLGQIQIKCVLSISVLGDIDHLAAASSLFSLSLTCLL